MHAVAVVAGRFDTNHSRLGLYMLVNSQDKDIIKEDISENAC